MQEVKQIQDYLSNRDKWTISKRFNAVYVPSNLPSADVSRMRHWCNENITAHSFSYSENKKPGYSRPYFKFVTEADLTMFLLIWQ